MGTTPACGKLKYSVGVSVTGGLIIKDPKIVSQKFVDIYRECVAKRTYIETMISTGCCYNRALAHSFYWDKLTDDNVWNEMYVYCKRAKDGSANFGQKSMCGCGNSKPSTCEKQTNWAENNCKRRALVMTIEDEIYRPYRE